MVNLNDIDDMLLKSPEEDIRDDKGVWKLQRRCYKDGYTQLIVSQMEWKVFSCTIEELVSFFFSIPVNWFKRERFLCNSHGVCRCACGHKTNYSLFLQNRISPKMKRLSQSVAQTLWNWKEWDARSHWGRVSWFRYVGNCRDMETDQNSKQSNFDGLMGKGV